MASKKQTENRIHQRKPNVKRPGVHAKTKASKLKQSKNYLKRNRGQG